MLKSHFAKNTLPLIISHDVWQCSVCKKIKFIKYGNWYDCEKILSYTDITTCEGCLADLALSEIYNNQNS